MNTRNLKKFPVLLAGASALCLSVLGTGCGSEPYRNVSTITQQESPGTYTIPPQLDLVLVEDDTGSMNEVYDSVASQMPTLLETLDAQGWDYHFTVIPLTQFRAISEVAASKYDSNWGSQWIAPYPGAQPNSNGTIGSKYFTKIGDFSSFLTLGDVSNNLMGKEPGFENIRQILSKEKALGSRGSRFLRDNALLAILVVGNGDDTSGIDYCTRAGYSVPCDSSQVSSSFNYYKSQFQALRSNAGLVKFYAAVSPRQTSSGCFGQGSYAGTRYMQMAQALGGKSFDVCSQSLSSVLAAVGENLHEQKLSMRTRYLFISEEPKLDSTFKVIKLVNGDPNNRIELRPVEEDGENGYRYIGKVDGVYAIDSPIPMNYTSGYAIELFGTAKLTGDDKAKVEFLPAWTPDN